MLPSAALGPIMFHKVCRLGDAWVVKTIDRFARSSWKGLSCRPPEVLVMNSSAEKPFALFHPAIIHTFGIARVRGKMKTIRSSVRLLLQILPDLEHL